MLNDFIPVMKPMIPSVDEALPYLRSMEASGVYSNFGPLVQALEERLAEWLGLPDSALVVTTTSATAALIGVCSTLDANRFIVPSFTFPATPLAVRRAGRELQLADISAESWLVDIPEEVTPRDAVIQVRPFGRSVTFAEIDHSGPVVLDAAASLGAVPPGALNLLPNQVIVFSLHATKVLGVGEGGFAVFGDRQDAERFRSWTSFGFTGKRVSVIDGTNAKMPEVTAAFAHAALDSSDREIKEWRAANQIARRITSEAGLTFYPSDGQGVSPYWIVDFKAQEIRDEAERLLHANKIETRRWWESGCHLMPAFSAPSNSQYRQTERVAAKTLGLPMFRGLSDRQGEVIGEVLQRSRA